MRLTHLVSLGLASFSAAAIPNDTAQSRNLLQSAFQPPKHFVNVNLVRNINLEKSYPRETINVVIENIDGTAQKEYFIPFDQWTLGRIGGLVVKDKKNPQRAGFKTEIVGIDPLSSIEYYKITLPDALPPKEQLTLTIAFHVLSAIEPLPAQIEQTAKQYVVHKFSAFAPSAYQTMKQKTKLKLPGTDIPNYTTAPGSLNAEGKADPQKQGTYLTYGPYDERDAGVQKEASVRYEFTKPLIHSKLLERDIEVSHWGGNIAFEERHWLTNRAATLKNHFSRVTYQQSNYFSPPTSALKELTFPLTVGSVDAYFTDDIGNVSTSRYRTNAREAHLELKPRYPVFGGWNYSFRVGWNANLAKFLRRSNEGGEAFVLKVPFFEGPKQSEGVEYERIVTRIILPEGSTNVKFETNMPLVSHDISFYRTFMDTIGRTTLTLTALHMTDEYRVHDLAVTYDYPVIARFRKPLTITAGVAVLFIISWVVGSIDVSIGKKKKKS